MDTVDKATRSKIMSSVGQKDTVPEMTLRRALHRLGYRYRLHDRKLPGSPDIVFPKYKAVIFVHGCYWHRHECHLSTTPKSRETFWNEKFEANQARDKRNIQELTAAGWRVLIVWQCSLKGKAEIGIDEVIFRATAWMTSDKTMAQIP